jgi:hypothetical protein
MDLTASQKVPDEIIGLSYKHIRCPIDQLAEYRLELHQFQRWSLSGLVVRDQQSGPTELSAGRGDPSSLLRSTQVCACTKRPT